MRNLIFLAAFLLGSGLALKGPLWGIIFYYWTSIANPHRYAWGEIQNLLPYAKIAAGLCLLTILMHPREIRFPKIREFYLILFLLVFLFISNQFALNPASSNLILVEVSKVFIMAIATMFIVNSREKAIKLLIAIVAFVGFVGVKGAVFTLATGGRYRIYGPEKSTISDNNDVGLALVIIIPLIFSLIPVLKKKWQKIIMLFIGVSSIISCIFTYSRGAFVGLLGIAMISSLFSKRKLTYLTLIVLSLPIAYFSLPEKYKSRISTIKNFRQDLSARQRLDSWLVSFRIASDRVFGGGFDCYLPEVYYTYSPEPWLNVYKSKETGELTTHTAHSIYFQMMAEHGFIGLFIFIGCFISLIFSLLQVYSIASRFGGHDWAFYISRGILIGIAGYLIAGAFLSRAYYEIIWVIFAIGATLKGIYYSELVERYQKAISAANASEVLTSVKSKQKLVEAE